VITKTVTVDTNGNIISQKIDSGNTNPTQTATPTATQVYNTSSTSQSNNPNFLNNMFGSSSNQIPSTTFPVMSSIPNTTLSQTLDCKFGSKTAFCPSAELNSEFKSYGIYGPP
jgi:hypothetical protein